MSVYFLGAGAGDPGRLSARGLQLLRQAGVVVYDAGATALLAEAPADAALHLAPPGAGTPWLLAAARSGQVACRLLTDEAPGVGAEAPGGPEVPGSFAALEALEAEALRAAGVACVALPGAPAPQPAGVGALAGQGVLVTRARTQAGALLEQIAALGGRPWLFPAIRTAPPADGAALDHALAQLPQYRWLIVTSANAVESFIARLWQAGGDARSLAHARIAAVGPATARTLQAAGLRADLLPLSARSAALPPALAPHLQPGDRLLIPRADLADAGLRQGLEALGCSVDDPIAYRTVAGDTDPAPVREALAAGRIAYATFTSGSTLRHTLAALGGAPALAGVRIAVLGPETAREAAALGLTVHVQTAGAGVEALVAAIAADAAQMHGP